MLPDVDVWGDRGRRGSLSVLVPPGCPDGWRGREAAFSFAILRSTRDEGLLFDEEDIAAHIWKLSSKYSEEVARKTETRCARSISLSDGALLRTTRLGDLRFAG
jgi:hypothetical protein